MEQTAEREYFNKNLNLSYVDESLPKPGNKIIFKHIISSLIVYLLVYVILCINPFLKGYISPAIKRVITNCLFAYMLVSPAIYFIFRPKSVYSSHNVHICDYFLKCIKNLKKLRLCHSIEDFNQMLSEFKPNYYEKSSMIFIFIKFFFGTIMISPALGNYEVLKQRFPEYVQLFDNFRAVFSNFSMSAIHSFILQWRDFIYYNFILLMFTLDITIFGFGYVTELYILKNKIRTVETTFTGLFFCLICYPPFVMATNKILGWNSFENAAVFNDPNHWLTWVFRIIGMFFLFIYVSASFALGTKASNLTNRGIVKAFPYNIIRHPAYVSKIAFWLCQFLPTIFIPMIVFKYNWAGFSINVFFAFLSLMAYALIYYIRALTEERHLGQDPDYREYKEKVKWQFIPGIF